MTTSLAHLPNDSLSHIFSFSKHPQSIMGVSKSVRDSAQCALHNWTQPSSSSFLNRIRDGYNKKFGKLNASDTEKVKKRADNIKKTAIRMIQTSAPLLTPDEWANAGYNPQAFSKDWDFDEMGTLIGNRRAENLISFFDWISTQSDAASIFRNSLSPQFTLAEKAKRIREWMAENSAMLDEIREIPIQGIFPEEPKQGIPPEIFQLKNLNIVTLGKILVSAAKNGNLEVVAKAISHDQFDYVDSACLNSACEDAAGNGHLSIVTALIECSRFDEIRIQDAFDQAAKKGHLEIVNAFIGCSKFHDLKLTTALESACESLPIAKSIMIASINRGTDFSESKLQDLFELAAKEGDFVLCQAIMKCSNFSKPKFKLALGHAALHGHLPIVKAILDSGKPITNEDLRFALSLAATNESCPEIIDLLLSSNKLSWIKVFQILGTSTPRLKAHMAQAVSQLCKFGALFAAGILLATKKPM